MKYSLDQRVFIYDNFVKYVYWRKVEELQNIQHDIEAISENELWRVAGHVYRDVKHAR